MKVLASILHHQPLYGTAVSAVSGITRDSRLADAGSLFVDCSGDSSAHVGDARAHGAVQTLSELPGAESAHVVSPHARWSFARAHAEYSGVAASPIPVLAVTGTKGKSTTSWATWWAMGSGAARVGTVGWHDGIQAIEATHTTPPPETLHAFIAGLPQTCPGIAVEASSHAGDQYRLAGVRMRGLVFTGLERDHLDYHGSIADYAQAKLHFVHELQHGDLLIINADDARAPTWEHAGRVVGARVVTLGFDHGQARLRHDGTVWRLHQVDGDLIVPCALPGRFNVFNMAAGALLATAAGVPLPTALARLATMPPIPGRLERCGEQPITYVDYAHTARSLELVIAAVRSAHRDANIVCVFGCGGDRDNGKRGPMGCAAVTADWAVLTTDNPRSESPESIADEVLRGIPLLDKNRVFIEHDRRSAIALARYKAGVDGVVVVCGKGHERVQIIGSQRILSDDRELVRDCSQAEARGDT